MKNAAHALEDMAIDYVELAVSYIEKALSWLVDGYGFAVRARSTPAGGATRSVNLGQGEIDLLLTESTEDHPARAYTERHSDGVADIGIRVPTPPRHSPRPCGAAHNRSANRSPPERSRPRRPSVSAM
ncbi:hypothetical protein [Salinispora arenicola]|uniref:hypothetical protein n=1 Tax=Salinispora arenicola TaxID=168697 RepID=UPI0027DBB29A|nr:hypothetical protein [Salinispora arenicola]